MIAVVQSRPGSIKLGSNPQNPIRPCHVWLVWWWYCVMTVWCGIPLCWLYQTRRPCCKSLLLDSAVLFHALTQLSLLLALEGATESVETHCQCWNSCTAARAAPCRLGNPRRTWSTTGKHDKSWADKATHEQYSGKLITSFSRLGSWKYRRREIRFNCHLKNQFRRNNCWQNSLFSSPKNWWCRCCIATCRDQRPAQHQLFKAHLQCQLRFHRHSCLPWSWQGRNSNLNRLEWPGQRPQGRAINRAFERHNVPRSMLPHRPTKPWNKKPQRKIS